MFFHFKLFLPFVGCVCHAEIKDIYLLAYLLRLNKYWYAILLLWTSVNYWWCLLCAAPRLGRYKQVQS